MLLPYCSCTETACWVCSRRVSGSVPFPVELLKTEMRRKVWKGLVTCKAGMASREFDLPCLAPDSILALAHQSGAKEYEPETHSPSVLFGFCFMDMESIRTFLRLESFSSRASGLLVFADNGSFGAAVLPFYFYLSRTEVGKKLFTTKLRVIYNVVTMASTPKASLDWARDYNVDVKQWPRRPDNFYKSPKKAIFRKLYDFVDDIKGVEYRLPIAQQLVTDNVAVSMNAQRSELERSMGEDSSSGVSSSNTSDSDSPAERGKRRRRGQGGRRGK